MPFPLLKRDVRMQSRFMIYFGAVVVAMMLLVILVVALLFRPQGILGGKK